MRKYSFFNRIFINLICTLLLVSCESKGQTAFPTIINDPMMEYITTVTSIPANSTSGQIDIPGYKHITPDNLHEIELLAELGVGKIIDVVVSPDNSRFAIFTVSGIYLFDIKTFEQINYLKINIQPENALNFTPDGNRIFYSNGQKILSWDFESAKSSFEFNTFIPDWKVRTIGFSPIYPNHILISSKGWFYPCDHYGINFALYDGGGDLLFDDYSCSAYSSQYHNFTANGNLEINFMSYFSTGMPYKYEIIDSITGNTLAKAMNDDGNMTITGDETLFPELDERGYWYLYEFLSQDKSFSTHCEQIIQQFGNEYRTIYSDEDTVILKMIYGGNVVGVSKYSLSTCQQLENIQFPMAENIHFGPNDQYLLSDDQFSITVWNLLNLKQQYSIPGTYFDAETSIYAINADGTKLFVSQNYVNSIKNDNGEQSISIIDIKTGEISRIIDPDTPNIKNIVPTDDPNIMIVQGKDISKIIILDSEIKTIPLPTGPFSLDAERGGIWILARENMKANFTPTLIDIRTGNTIKQFNSIDGIPNIIYLDDNPNLLKIDYAAITTRNRMVMTIDIITEKKIDLIKNDFHSSNEYFIEPYAWGHNVLADSEITLFNDAGILNETPDIVNYLSPDILMTKGSYYYQFWNAHNGDYLGYKYFPYSWDDVQISPNSNFFTVLNKDGIIRIYGIKD